MRLSVSLTPRGQALTASAGALALGAFLSGALELYGLSAAALVLVVVAWGRARFASWDVAFTRTVTPARVAVGGTCRVDVVACNTGGRASPRAEGRDPFGDTGRTARFSIASLRPSEVRRTSYRVTPSRRGVYSLGPLSVRVIDPFGLAEAVGRAAGEAKLRVHPQFEVLPDSALPGGGRLRRRATGQSDGTEPDTFLLKRYSVGDDIRRVHWPTTARVGDLTLRHDEPRHSGLVVVLADLRRDTIAGDNAPSSYPDAEIPIDASQSDALETILEATATLAVSWLRAGYLVRLVTSAGFDSGRGAGQAHSTTILDALSEAAAHATQQQRLPELPSADIPVVVVTTDKCDQRRFVALVGQRTMKNMTVVCVATPLTNPTPCEADMIPTASFSLDEAGPGSRIVGPRRQIRIPVGSTLARHAGSSVVEA